MDRPAIIRVLGFGVSSVGGEFLGSHALHVEGIVRDHKPYLNPKSM